MMGGRNRRGSRRKLILRILKRMMTMWSIFRLLRIHRAIPGRLFKFSTRKCWPMTSSSWRKILMSTCRSTLIKTNRCGPLRRKCGSMSVPGTVANEPTPNRPT
uniref:(northern house mosquito) hypothetical protein n=1 Tax=Culex pipiens TaxID=7175 RepID=A0A8D8J1C6_CULPI